MIRVPELETVLFNEKEALIALEDSRNPVLVGADYVYNRYDLAKLNPTGIASAAYIIRNKILEDQYTPCVWRMHPLHLVPPMPFDPLSPRTKETIDWIFLISTLNFSFWSDQPELFRYGVEWRTAWGSEERRVWTGYWSLVASVNSALESGIPITSPSFYASTSLCPDALLASVFLAAPSSIEPIPLLHERILALREVGQILCTQFNGSFQNLLETFIKAHDGRGTALQLVQMVVELFPSFRDEIWLQGRKVCFWKRAQILVAELWAAFFPESGSADPHPYFPQGITELTMFADYRVPQILHHLNIISYPESLQAVLRSRQAVPTGSPVELSIRAASILAVEAIRREIMQMDEQEQHVSPKRAVEGLSSVLIDFFLWDLAKRVESGEEVLEDDAKCGFTTQELLPAHRTRCIWY